MCVYMCVCVCVCVCVCLGKYTYITNINTHTHTTQKQQWRASSEELCNNRLLFPELVKSENKHMTPHHKLLIYDDRGAQIFQTTGATLKH